MSDGTTFKAEHEVVNPAGAVDWGQAQWAQKTAQVIAEFVPVGTSVTTITKDGTIETTNTISSDNGYLSGGYLVTNPGGEQYIVKPEVFLKRYDNLQGNDYKPTWGPIRVVKVDRDISFLAPNWGQVVNLKAGGVIAWAGGNDFYPIQGPEFGATYSTITEPGGIRPDTMPESSVALVTQFVNNNKHTHYLDKTHLAEVSKSGVSGIFMDAVKGTREVFHKAKQFLFPANKL